MTGTSDKYLRKLHLPPRSTLLENAAVVGRVLPFTRCTISGQYKDTMLGCRDLRLDRFIHARADYAIASSNFTSFKVITESLPKKC
jgi:hypothetical protein